MQLFMHYIILYVRGMTLPDMTNHALTLPLSHSNSFIIHHFAATNFLFPYCLIWFIAILLFHYTKLVSILPHTPIWLKITVHLVHHQSISGSKSRVIVLLILANVRSLFLYLMITIIVSQKKKKSRPQLMVCYNVCESSLAIRSLNNMMKMAILYGYYEEKNTVVQCLCKKIFIITLPKFLNDNSYN